jgi:hypothetical protein
VNEDRLPLGLNPRDQVHIRDQRRVLAASEKIKAPSAFNEIDLSSLCKPSATSSKNESGVRLSDAGFRAARTFPLKPAIRSKQRENRVASSAWPTPAEGVPGGRCLKRLQSQVVNRLLHWFPHGRRLSRVRTLDQRAQESGPRAGLRFLLRGLGEVCPADSQQATLPEPARAVERILAPNRARYQRRCVGRPW